MVEVYKLADELGVSSIEIFSVMEKLDVRVQLPNPSVSIDDAQKIKSHLKKGSRFSIKNISFFISAVVFLMLVFSINSNSAFADDTATSTPIVKSSSYTDYEPAEDPLLDSKESVLVASEGEPDPFTVIIQEMLIDLGILSNPVTGINDKQTQEAIKSFQEKAGLQKIDGLVGSKTFTKLLLGESAYTASGLTTVSNTQVPASSDLQVPASSDSEAPIWGEDEIAFSRVGKGKLDILWGHVTDNIGITTFNFYVDGNLHLTISVNACKTGCSSLTSGLRGVLTDLTKGKDHDFIVQACDAAGNCADKRAKPRWDKSNPPYASEIGTRFNLNIPSTPSDFEIVRYEVYVNGSLSTYTKVSETRLFVTPKYDMSCDDQYIQIIGFDADDNETEKSPYFIIPKSDPCIGTTADTSSGSTTTTTTVVTGKLADCGDSTTSANRWVVSVIDEDSSFGNPNAVWNSFRGSYPNRCFHLLGPGTPVASTSLKTGQLSYNGVSWDDEVTNGTAFRYQVNRDSGITASRSDWWDLIGADVLPSGAKIALCVDNSGSMRISTVQASVNYFVEQATAAGVTIFAPSGGTTSYNCSGMSSEDWITGHNVAMD